MVPEFFLTPRPGKKTALVRQPLHFNDERTLEFGFLKNHDSKQSAESSKQ